MRWRACRPRTSRRCSSTRSGWWRRSPPPPTSWRRGTARSRSGPLLRAPVWRVAAIVARACSHAAAPVDESRHRGGVQVRARASCDLDEGQPRAVGPGEVIARDEASLALRDAGLELLELLAHVGAGGRQCVGVALLRRGEECLGRDGPERLREVEHALELL